MNILPEVSNRADSGEIYESTVRSTPVKFTSGELDYVKSVSSKGFALRVIKDGKMGYSTTTDPNEKNELVNRAMESSDFGDQASFDFPSPRSIDKIDVYDPLVDKLSLEEMIDTGYGIIKKIEDSYPEVEVDLNISKTEREVKVKNTSGLDLSERRTLIGASISAQKVEKDDIFSCWKEITGRRKKILETDFLVNEIQNRLRWAERVEEIENGPKPVVFTPSGAMVLILPLIAGLNGRNKYLGTSPVCDRLGEKVFNEKFTLIDDGRIKDSVRGCSFDDEGFPTSRNHLIKKGELKGFYYDQSAAGLSGEEPTGNGFKGGLRGGSDFQSPPESGPSCWIVEKGEKNLGKIIKDINDGLLVDGVLGLGQGNVLSGEFSNNVSVAYRIKDGLIKGRVKNTMIAGNVYDLLREQLIGLGNNREWVYGALKLPSLAVDNVHLVHK